MPSAKPLRAAMNSPRKGHVKIWLRAFFVLLAGATLSSCIEFEHEVIQYHYDASADQLRMTLTYEGIFGGNSAPLATKDAARQPADSKELTGQQKEQMESVLKGGRAFFFNNWIFEFNHAGIQETLLKSKDANSKDSLTPQAKKLLHAILKNTELKNLGFYLDTEGRLCGTQMLVIKGFSNLLEDTNEVIRVAAAREIQKQRAEVKAGEKKPEDALSGETLALWKKACAKGHDLLIMKQGRLVVRAPLGKHEYLEFKKEILDEALNPEDPAARNLPEEVSFNYRDNIFTFVLGEEKNGTVRLTKKCFLGYRDNALRYLREKHPNLLKDEAKIEADSRRFLNGGD
ncbi:MAG: hypothetical protein CMJ96_06045 [Planctomycetes bacterium]|nr:hypothetical protein [Planctomycetota bacterium]